MNSVKKKLYRDRRRYAVCWILLFLAGLLSFWASDTRAWGLPMPLAAGLAFVLGIGIFVPPLCVLLPRYRQACEIVSLTLFLWVLASLWLPQLSIETTARDALGMFLFVLAANCLALLVYGGWSDGLFRLKRAQNLSHAWTRLPADAIWPRIYTTPRTVTMAADPTIIDVSYLEDGQSRRILRRVPPGATLEEHHLVETLTPRQHVRYTWRMIDPTPGAGNTTGTVEITLHPKADGTGIETRRTRPDLPARHALASWLDDSFGRVDDAMIATAERMEAARGRASIRLEDDDDEDEDE